MSKEELNNLTDEQKQKIVDEVNAEPESQEGDDGNTSIFTMNDIDEKAGEGSAQEQYEKSVTANAQAIYTLEQMFNMKGTKISNRNLKKLIFATLKLPEEGAVLKFGGTKQQQQMCEMAYAYMQLAANSRAFILGVNAMRQARRDRKAAEEEADNQSKEESSQEENKENSNE